RGRTQDRFEHPPVRLETPTEGLIFARLIFVFPKSLGNFSLLNLVMKLEGLSIIGQTRARAAGKPTPSMNPATGTALGPDCFWATAADVGRAGERAGNAFAEFRLWPGKRRAGLLRRIAELIEANATATQERANQETALPIARLQGETVR